MKLAREEDASRFGRWPLLRDRPGPGGSPRYALCNLVGKGGFSEVFKVGSVCISLVCVLARCVFGWHVSCSLVGKEL